MTSDAVTAWVVEGESSAVVTRSSARQLERDTLTEIVDRMEAQHGPVDQNEVDEIAARLVDR
jgi:hypothetical protein